VVNSEKLLDEINPDGANIVSAMAIPKVSANPKAINRILSSDYIIAGPGDLYSSIISIALVDGVSEAVKKSGAKLIYIMNIMTKASQTLKYTASQHIRDFTKYFGRVPDICIINTDIISPSMTKLYGQNDEAQVVDDLKQGGYDGKVVYAALLDSTIQPKSKEESIAATFAHSIVRHDEHKLEICLEDLLK
jgi:uncharacterized cofD-like protein